MGSAAAADGRQIQRRSGFELFAPARPVRVVRRISSRGLVVASEVLRDARRRFVAGAAEEDFGQVIGDEGRGALAEDGFGLGERLPERHQRDAITSAPRGESRGQSTGVLPASSRTISRFGFGRLARLKD